jgi:hypothetical protein
VSGFVLVAVLAALAVMAITGRPLTAPDWMLREAEARANAALGGEARVTVGAVEVVVDRGIVPRLRLSGVEVTTKAGGRLAGIDDLGMTLDATALMSGRAEPTALRLSGVHVSLQRLSDGSFDLPNAAPDEDVATRLGGALSPADMGAALDRLSEVPALARLARIEASDVDLTFSDQRSGQTWSATGGRVTLDQTAESIAASLGFDVRAGAGAPSRLDLDLASRKRSPDLRVEVRLKNVPARDLAGQVPAFVWLGALDAGISGTLRTGIDETGALRQTAATLEISEGAIRPGEGAAPVPFQGAAVDLTYDPLTGRIAASRIAFDSRALTIEAEAAGRLVSDPGALPSALEAQVRITDLRADPEGLFVDPVVISQGAADLRLSFDPFRLTLGQLVLIDQGRRIDVAGDLGAEAKGWRVALDIGIDAIESRRLLALWPLGVVPKTRAWLDENVATAEVRDLKAGLRLVPGQDPALALGYEFRGADVRFLKTLPPISGGEGYATVYDNAYTITLEKGRIAAPKGGEIDVAGTSLQVTDIRVVPAIAKVRLRSESTITAALSLLDEPPFRFLTRAGRPTDAAEGRARVEAEMSFPLKRKVLGNEVAFGVTARLTDVSSDRLMPGRTLLAEALDVGVDPSGMTVSGRGTLDGVPFDATWTQGFGPADRGRSGLSGTIELSERFLKAFRIGLPPGSVTGTGTGEIAIGLSATAPARFTLSSDLSGLALRIPGLTWSKRAEATGSLEVAGTLGRGEVPPRVERLALAAEGLEAEGDIRLRTGGELDRASFPSVRIGGWFDGGIEIRGQGAGKAPGIAVTSGTADLTTAGLGGRGGGGPVPLTVTLDRLRVGQGIALTGFRGEFTTGGGLLGGFTARVNDGAPIAGTVEQVDGRAAFRLSSEDAGGVFRSAGVFTRGRGGKLTGRLVPTGEPGSYTGRINVENIRVVDAPVLAELLGAISVIGLLEQLGGAGILFNDVNGRFNLTPGGIEIERGSAIGVSLGVSAQGLYRFADKRIDLQGTVSPIYIVNAIGRPFTKSREGLFGFNYSIEGPSDAPKVSVNPLSILTPGMFREIFRRPVPKLQE